MDREIEVMDIKIQNFYSLKNVEFSIKKGISVLAGKNGSGKSQVLMAIAHRYGSYDLLNYYGYKSFENISVNVSPEPQLILWRPPVRKIAEHERNMEYAEIGSVENFINKRNRYGYTYYVDERFARLHRRVCNVFVAGTIRGATERNREIWDKIQSMFYRVFNKHLDGEFSEKGGKVGIRVGDELSNFSTLSTGEQEFISLLCDLLTEDDVDLFLIDEIDTHFHPNLQRIIIDEIKELCHDKYVLVTSHSPAVMLSVDPGNLFYIKNSSEVETIEENGTKTYNNQILKVSDDLSLIDSLIDMYGNIFNDIKISKHYGVLSNHELLEYTNECLKEANPVKAEDRDVDPQIASIRSILLGILEQTTIVEIGAGYGRLLNAFKTLSPQLLSKMDYVASDIKEEYIEKTIKYAERIKIKDKFNSFRTVLHPNEPEYDICILANVLHEIYPTNLVNFFNTLIDKAKPMSKIIILEVGELPQGEKDFVLFNVDAVKALFEPYSENIIINAAEPRSFQGLPMMDIVLHIKKKFELTSKDIIRALKVICANEVKKIREKILMQHHLNSRQLSFAVHNLAHAEAFLSILDE